jgi:hypothetical protein
VFESTDKGVLHEFAANSPTRCSSDSGSDSGGSRYCIFLYVVTVLAHITLKFINDSLQQTKNKSHHSNKSYRTTVTTVQP